MKSQLLRLLVAASFGVTGFLGNVVWVRKQVAPDEVVVMTQSIATGERIPADGIRPVELPGHPALAARDLVPWSKRGLVIGRVAVRSLGPNNALLFSDLSTRRQPPANRRLQFVDLDNVAYHDERIRPGDGVFFVVRAGANDKETRIGPFEVFDPPLPGLDPRSGRVGDGMAMSVLTDAKGNDENARSLSRAIADRAIRGIELAGGVAPSSRNSR